MLKYYEIRNVSVYMGSGIIVLIKYSPDLRMGSLHEIRTTYADNPAGMESSYGAIQQIIVSYNLLSSLPSNNRQRFELHYIDIGATSRAEGILHSTDVQLI